MGHRLILLDVADKDLAVLTVNYLAMGLRSLQSALPNSWSWLRSSCYLLERTSAASSSSTMAFDSIEKKLFSTFPPWLSDAKTRIATPLNAPLPGVHHVPAYMAPSEAPPTKVTVLKNGVRVISEASPVSSVVRYQRDCEPL